MDPYVVDLYDERLKQNCFEFLAIPRGFNL